MNRSEKVVPCLEQVEQKESYEKPKVTTFGSVASLTMSGGASTSDGAHTKRHATKTHG